MNMRRATLADADVIATVHVRAWQSVYIGIVPAQHLESLSVERRAAVWRDSLARARCEVWVAEEAGRVIGWVAFGPSRDAGAQNGTAEVEAIHVSPEHWSAGIGRALWEVAHARLVEKGYRAVTLWVLAENTRAIQFYTAAGFAATTTGHTVEIGGKALEEVRYGRELA